MKRELQLTWTEGATISLLVGIALFVVVKIADWIDKIPGFVWCFLLGIFLIWGVRRTWLYLIKKSR